MTDKEKEQFLRHLAFIEHTKYERLDQMVVERVLNQLQRYSDKNKKQMSLVVSILEGALQDIAFIKRETKNNQQNLINNYLNIDKDIIRDYNLYIL